MLVIYKLWSVNIEELKHVDGLFKTAPSIYYDKSIFPGKIRADILRETWYFGSFGLSEAGDSIGGANGTPITGRINVELEQAVEEAHSSETNHVDEVEGLDE